ncbi:hypothetical protein PIB30_102141 [Stylosanthes scabra]|uniref:Uncharacterized protein n=1 Tax=Stylosanthes scabra TaxID=79078 RepID=A0ABU6QX16_9FABA|nr:hypothetical protein [Stylosanthes scabra]
MESGADPCNTIGAIMENLKVPNAERNEPDLSQLSDGEKGTAKQPKPSVEDPAAMVLRMVKEHLLVDNEKTKDILSTIFNEMKRMSEVQVEQEKAIQQLTKRVYPPLAETIAPQVSHETAIGKKRLELMERAQPSMQV